MSVLSFGCRLNAAESAAIEAMTAGDSALVVVNTCAVTAEAERDAAAAIRRVARERPDARIVVTGCAAQIDPGRWRAMDGVSAVVGNREKLEPATWTEGRHAVGDIMAARDFVAVEPPPDPARTREFLEIQQGCDHRCTFCVIPYGRGNSRSLPLDRVLARARAAVAAGKREIVLTGVDLTSWGADLPGAPKLGAAAKTILAECPDLARLRLSSVDPAEIDADIFDLLAREPRFAGQLHLSIQSGDDLILKRMKRRHSRADVLAVAARARAARADVALTADLIAGFPTESDTAFATTRALVAEIALADAHVFPYSARPGTPAARMPALAPETVARRASELRAAVAEARARDLAARVGAIADVLIEAGGDNGLDARGTRVRLDASFARGAMVRARVTGHDGRFLKAAA
ncbi:MAG: MiaB/RimO family radical SAM methylthiotransferase [Tagaea sp.]